MTVSSKVMLRENVLESFAAHQKALADTDLSERAPYLQRPLDVAATHSGSRELPFAVYPASQTPQSAPQIDPCDAGALLNLLAMSSPIGSELPVETQTAISTIRSEHLVYLRNNSWLGDGIPQKATPFSSDAMLVLSNSGRRLWGLCYLCRLDVLRGLGLAPVPVQTGC